MSAKSDAKKKPNELNDSEKALPELARNAKVTRSLRSSLNKTNEEMQNNNTRANKNNASSRFNASQEFIESNENESAMLKVNKNVKITDILTKSLNKTNGQVQNKSANINDVSTRSDVREEFNELNSDEEAVLQLTDNAKVTRSLRSSLNKTNDKAADRNKSVNGNNVSAGLDGRKELNETANDKKADLEEPANVTNSFNSSLNKTNEIVQGKDKSVNKNNVSSDAREKSNEFNNDEKATVELARNANNMYIDKASFFVDNREKSSRKTSIRLNELRPSLAPLRESTGISDGTKDSSTERSGWDSHRTTRKTLRQTFGRDFTPRKSLRALVMEKSAKRQTQGFNATSKTPLASSTKLPDNFHLSARDDDPAYDDMQQEPNEQLDNDNLPTADDKVETSKTKNLSRVSQLNSTNEKGKSDDSRNSNFNKGDGGNMRDNVEIEESEEETTNSQDAKDLQNDEEIGDSPDGEEEEEGENSQDIDMEDEESGAEMENSQDAEKSKGGIDGLDNKYDEEIIDSPGVEDEEDTENSQSIENKDAESDEDINNDEHAEEGEKTTDSRDMQNDEEITDNPDIEEDEEAENSQDIANDESESGEEMENSQDNEEEESKEECLISQNSTTNVTDQRYSINNDTEQSTNIDESNHDISRTRRQNALEVYLQKMRQQNLEKRRQTEEAIRNSLKARRETSDIFKVPLKPISRRPISTARPKAKSVKPNILGIENLPPEIVEDMKYKPPRRYQPPNASWITKRLYKYLEAKLEPKYDYKARVRAEKLAEMLFEFAKEVRRRTVAEESSVELLKTEMARLGVVSTHFEFYQFFHEFMPREIRVKVVPDVVNKISMPKHGIFSNIIR